MSISHLIDPLGDRQDIYCKSLIIAGSIVYNVKSYGAIGDGVHDDIQALRNCFAACRVTGGTMLFPAGTYLVSGGFGTEPLVAADLCNGVTVLGENAEIYVDTAQLPVSPPSTRIICLEGNNNAVINMRFRGSVEFDMENKNPSTYYPPIIICIEIGGKAAVYNGAPDSIANYKEQCAVIGCSFNYVHTPIIVSQVSSAIVAHNNITNWITTAILLLCCPTGCFIAYNRLLKGSDDCIYAGLSNASACAWVAAGLYAGGHVIHGNRLERTRAKFVGVSGYSDVVVSNNTCDLSLNSGMVVQSNPIDTATGALYGKRYKFIGNIINRAGRYYDTQSGYDYWRGPVDGENMGISFSRQPGTRVTGLPYMMNIENNIINNPSGIALDLGNADMIIASDNQCIAGVNDQGSGPVPTLAMAIRIFNTTDIVLRDNQILQDGADWTYTYTIFDDPELIPDSVHIMNNWDKTGETFQGLNPTSEPSIVKYYPLVPGA